MSADTGAVERYGTDAQLGPILSRAAADSAAAAGRDIPDRRTPAHRVDLERRRVRRQASRELDQALTPEGARVRRVLADAERDQEFYRLAGAWLADISRALDYAEPDEVLRRAEAMTAALRAVGIHQNGGGAL